jgi:hypothetical protein
MRYLLIEFIFLFIISQVTAKILNLGSSYWYESKIAGIACGATSIGVFVAGLYVSLSYVSVMFFNS